jgi:FMN phosphatase YigB (HAD superfamily)
MINYMKPFLVALCSMAFGTLISEPSIIPFSTTGSKILIWDLGNTLLAANTVGFASEIGWADFLLYPLLDWKNPFHIREKVFIILDSLAIPQKGDTCFIATAEGRVLPTVMCNWLAGKQSGAEICDQARLRIEEYERIGYFKSQRQKRLIERTVEAMFDPEKLAKHMYSIKSGLSILRQCAEQYDHRGKPRHKLYILSNWDPDSFRSLYNSQEFKKILAYVNPENIIISGSIGAIKPHTSVYEYFIKKCKVNPRDCILIDDQHENIESAKRSGMHGIHLENGNYRKLKRHLKALQVF